MFNSEPNNKYGFATIWIIFSALGILVSVYLAAIFNFIPNLKEYFAYKQIKVLKTAVTLYYSDIQGNIYSKNKDIIF